MSVSADFYKFSKRKNSTKQPTGAGTAYNVDLKGGTSFMSPTLLLNNSGYPDFNYVVFNGWYYFIKNIVSVRNDLWEIFCEVDPLATAKTAITASTQYVSYSSKLTSTWLADTRIPLQKNATVASNSSTMNFLFNDSGFYVLSVVGKDGSEIWACDRSHIQALLDRVNNWSDDLIDDILNGNYPWSDPPSTAVTYDFSNDPYGSLAKMNMLTGFCGNAYANAPSCIRSCIWVPFFATFFTGIGSDEIYLGQFNTQITTFKCKAEPATRTASVSIPWQYSDWRRAVCETVYLYLPMVGLVQLPSDELINESTINVEWSATASDGCIAYRISAGSQIIGTYGANCAVNVPIGINQQASAGEIVQSTFQGAQKTASGAIQAAGGFATGNVMGMANGLVNAATGAVETAYNTVDTVLSTHVSCIGGIGGGAGVGLSLDLKCFTVAHPTVVNPSDMRDTMGVPTMAPTLLSTLTGYCECANAHVALDLPSPIMDAVDSYLNSGFYIE